jgi:hypothetical protein
MEAIDLVLRVVGFIAVLTSGVLTVVYQRHLSVAAAQKRLSDIQGDTITAMSARVTEAREALDEHERARTEHRLIAIQLEACERERRALEAIVNEWDRWVGNVWLTQARDADGGADETPPS